jgi:hypothetical protein
MSRWISPLNEAAAQRSNILGVWLLDLDFESGHVRANDSGANLLVGPHTYYGVGTFGTFDDIDEDSDFVARGKRFELGGVDPGLNATILSERYQGRSAKLYVGLLPERSMTFVDTPELRWAGYMDTMRISRSGKTKKIILQCEHRLRNAPEYSRFSDADQQGRSPGDRFFELLHIVEGYISSWGGKSTRWITGPGGKRTPHG